MGSQKQGLENWLWHRGGFWGLGGLRASPGLGEPRARSAWPLLSGADDLEGLTGGSLAASSERKCLPEPRAQSEDVPVHVLCASGSLALWNERRTNAND